MNREPTAATAARGAIWIVGLLLAIGAIGVVVAGFVMAARLVLGRAELTVWTAIPVVLGVATAAYLVWHARRGVEWWREHSGR